jgi:radical SAM superfamily enzyme YgiQ (UPF0313 family)
MNLALISPRGSSWSNNPQFKDFWENAQQAISYRNYWTGLSPGLLVIAALTPSTYSIKLIDENVETVDFSQCYDLVGISGMTQQATRAYQIADEFRKKGTKVVIGGIHATILPEEAKQHSDSVVIGEAEYSWPKLIKDFENGTLLPFYKSERIVDLNDSPIPRYDLLDKAIYSTIWIQTSRGCPHDCEFCAASKVYGRKYRNKSILQILEEISFIKKTFGDVRLYFSDDNFFVNKNLRQSLLEKLIPLKIRWMAQSDISIAKDAELLRLAQKSGCTFLFIGFESLSEESLRGLDSQNWKLRQSKHYSEYVNAIQTKGIGVQGAFIVGLDTDDATVFESITDFTIQNHLYGVNYSILTPIPGTRVREKLLSENRVLQTSWDNYTGYDVNFTPKKMSASQLQEGLINMYKRVTQKEVFLKNMAYFKKIQKDLILDI